MVWASLFTTPFGLTEPLFVPEYWSPPSLFDLARTTGFDLESLIFCFAIGGVGAVLVNVLSGRQAVPLPSSAHHDPRHRFHRLALAAPFLVFPVLWLIPWNPIYPGIVAMGVGTAATIACRPDLLRNTVTGAIVFTGYYVIFLVGLQVTAPGYIERVWNLEALSGWTPFGLPVEEMLFAAGFGGYWAGVYEHVTWHRSSASSGAAPGSTAVGSARPAASTNRMERR